MCKNKRLVAVEIVNNFVIHWLCNVLQSLDSIIIISADEDVNIRRILSDATYTIARHTIPCIAIFLISNLI
jgi:hypothetical protein